MTDKAIEWTKEQSERQTAREIEIKQTVNWQAQSASVIQRQEGASSLQAYFYNSARSVSHEEGGKSMWDQGITRK